LATYCLITFLHDVCPNVEMHVHFDSVQMTVS